MALIVKTKDWDIAKVKQIKKPKGITLSRHARIFDEESLLWSEDKELTIYMLQQVQNHCNEKLRIEGHLFLNDVYEMLGIPTSEYWSRAGWIYGDNNYVDFGLYDQLLVLHTKNNAILLNFNVDYLIAEKI